MSKGKDTLVEELARIDKPAKEALRFLIHNLTLIVIFTDLHNALQVTNDEQGKKVYRRQELQSFAHAI